MKNRRLVAGFTLLELLVTIAIIGILLAAALPSYFNSVRKSNRAEAKVFMVEAAQKLQRCYTVYGRYNHEECDIFKKLSGAGQTTDQKFYDITLGPDGDLPVTTNYRLTATAREDGAQHKDIEECRVLMINQQGVKTPLDCW